jgi:hypothetical protein
VTRASRSVARLSAVPTAGESPRAFRLCLLRTADEGYGLTLEESYGDHAALTAPVTTVSRPQTGRVIDAVLAAVRASGHAPSVLSSSRKTPIRLDEPAGVRLALVLLATQPMTRNDRIRGVVAGINSMSVEETYYWYAKCVGPQARRALKALRTLLSDV